jgi:hypothetical protein
MLDPQVANRLFCDDAEERRYEDMDGNFYKDYYLKPSEADPNLIGVMRSIKSQGRNRYAFVMDFDADGVTEELEKAARLATTGLRNYFDIDTFGKETGNTGIHVVGFVKFAWRMDDIECRQYMANMAFTVWKLMNLNKLGVNIGKGCERPYIDMCMYDRRRLVRAFSKHPKSGRLPQILWGEHVLDPFDRAKEYQKPKEGVPMMKYREKKKGVARKKWMDEPPPRQVPGNEINNMPVGLKKLVAFTGDPDHESKWGLVLWLRAHTDWSTERIAKWIWANCKWEDLDNWGKTKYHVAYTCTWSDNIFEIEGRRPVPRWCYGEIPSPEHVSTTLSERTVQNICQETSDMQ